MVDIDALMQALPVSALEPSLMAPPHLSAPDFIALVREMNLAPPELTDFLAKGGSGRPSTKSNVTKGATHEPDLERQGRFRQG